MPLLLVLILGDRVGEHVPLEVVGPDEGLVTARVGADMRPLQTNRTITLVKSYRTEP